MDSKTNYFTFCLARCISSLILGVHIKLLNTRVILYPYLIIIKKKILAALR